MTARKYLVLPRLEYRGANAMTSWWCSGAPGPMAARGFANALAIAIGGRDAMSWVQGASVVHHDFELRAERIKNRIYPHQLRAASFVSADDYAGTGTTLSSQPTLRCDGISTIVVALDESAPVDAEEIHSFLWRARFSGGVINKHQFNKTRPLISDTLAEATDVVRSGFSFHDREDLLSLQGDESDPLGAFLRATRRMKNVKKDLSEAEIVVVKAGTEDEEDDDAIVIKPVQDSWLHPYLAGYRRLTSIDRNAKSRDGHPHAFAEPLVGLSQLISVRGKQISMWDYFCADGLHLVKQTN